ncbi:FixH family protein [Pseudalkalibacillus sp. Hm43]|uniref:FixH family protein n=1 Tax=Pseudalkalibacillus sp. Hm43 TaxID=3450742 RepID=UPI003F43F041
MKKFKLFLPMFVLMLVLAACGDQGNHDGHSEDESHGEHGEDMGGSMEALEVKLDGPEEVKQGDSVTFKAMVTQGEEHVADADEVMFEIWKEGAKDESKMIEASNEGGGMYSIETTFDEEGTFFVQSHVTARSMHTMPKQQVTVTKSE